MWLLAAFAEVYLAVLWLLDGVEGAGNVLLFWLWLTTIATVVLTWRDQGKPLKMTWSMVAVWLFRMGEVVWLVWFGAWFTAIALLIRTVMLVGNSPSKVASPPSTQEPT